MTVSIFRRSQAKQFKEINEVIERLGPEAQLANLKKKMNNADGKWF